MQEFIRGEFDVQVDGNHRYDEGVTEIDAYAQIENAEGKRETITDKHYVSIRLPSRGYADDVWYDSGAEGAAGLPAHVRLAFEASVTLAKVIQDLEEGHPVWYPGDTVFLTGARMPGQVDAVTLDGRYVIDMGDTGVRDIFRADQLEPYKAELWNDQ